MAKFVVEIGGEVGEVTRSLKELGNGLKDLKVQVKQATTTVDVERFNIAIKNTENEIKRINKIGTIIPNAATKGIDQATFALTNIGRVAQDLPFGFIGIANNLNPLLESFQRLRKETGSAKLAMQALGSSLVGAGGVGLALSIVTSIMQFASIGLRAWGVKSNEAKEQTDKLKESIKDLGLITGQAEAGTRGQISLVTSLASAISDANKPYAERKRALEELKDINKAYFGDLKLEDAATGALTKTVQEYTKALVNSAIQKEFVSEIAKVAKAVVESDAALAKAQTRLLQAQTASIDAAELDAATRKVGVTTDNASAAAKRKLTAAENEVRTAAENSTKLLEQQALLYDQLNKAVAQGLKLKDLDASGSKREEDLLKKRLDALEKIKAVTKDVNALVGIQESIFEVQVKIAFRDQDKNQLSEKEIHQLIKGYQEQLNQAFLNQALELEASPKITFQNVSRVEIPKAITDVISKATGKEKITITLHDVRVKLLGSKVTTFIEGKEAINAQLSEQINQTFENLKIESLETLGETIGNALTGGNFADALKAGAQKMLGIIGGVMVQLGKHIIQAAIQIKALKELVAAFAIKNPAIAILGGVALIAAGTALKNVSFEGPKFADGAIATGPTIGMFGEAGKEAIIPLNRLPSLMAQMNNNGVNPSGKLEIGLGIRGRELVAFLDRERTNYNRLV